MNNRQQIPSPVESSWPALCPRLGLRVAGLLSRAGAAHGRHGRAAPLLRARRAHDRRQRVAQQPLCRGQCDRARAAGPDGGRAAHAHARLRRARQGRRGLRRGDPAARGGTGGRPQRRGRRRRAAAHWARPPLRDDGAARDRRALRRARQAAGGGARGGRRPGAVRRPRL
eukprot:4937400-Prymnesium_polylepis.1